MRDEIDYGPIPLNPGIVRTVALLREHGFETTDSGDGETHAAECDQMTGYVAIATTPDKVISTAGAVAKCLHDHGVTIVPMGPSTEEQGGACVQATYDVANGSAMILVEGIHDRMLNPASGGEK